MAPKKLLAGIALTALVFAGCTKEKSTEADGTPEPTGSASVSVNKRPNPPVVATAASLERFDACPDLLNYLHTEGKKRVGPYGLNSWGGVVAMSGAATGAAMEDSAASAAQSESRSSAATSDVDKAYSSTNVQEADVDEPDRFKTNGEHIFTVLTDYNNNTQRLTSLAADGKLGKLAGGLALPEGSGNDLLLAGDRLMVLGGQWYTYAARGMEADMMYPGGGGDGRAVITIVDVSDPTNMKITKVVRLEGQYASARMVGGVARLVLNSTQDSKIDFEQPATGTPEAVRAALAKNQRIASTAPIEDWLPRFKVEDRSGNKQSEGPLATCDTTYRTRSFSGFQTTSVVTIDPNDPDPRNSAAVVGGAGIVYASTDNLYIATQRYPEPQPLAFDSGGNVTTMPVEPQRERTSIHRFDIRDATAAYAGSGEVEGTVLNQWSLSEHAGHLRVATTTNAWDINPDGSGENNSQSFITVLDATAGKLAQTGKLGGLGKGERIYGVRMMGGVGYVVTFRQVDPLHVIDLSDPKAPKQLGELKIPGYSAYLHPVGEGLLLGVGQDADEETGGTLGTQLSLFDVRDPANPKRIDSVRLDRASSPVEYDHKAFTWWGPKNLALIPVSRYDEAVAPQPGSPDGSTKEEYQQNQLHAVIGYRVNSDGISEVGRVNHAKHVDDPGMGMIERSIIVDGNIYTFSGAGAMASGLDDYAEHGWVSFS